MGTTVTRQVVHLCTPYKGYDRGPVPASACGNTPLDELRKIGEDVSYTARVNCPDCRARMIRIEEDCDSGALLLVWPTAGPDALPPVLMPIGA